MSKLANTIDFTYKSSCPLPPINTFSLTPSRPNYILYGRFACHSVFSEVQIPKEIASSNSTSKAFKVNPATQNKKNF